MLSLPVGVLCAVLSATRLWTVSSLEDVYSDSVPPPGAEPEVRLYAARGEYESFQICVRSSFRGIDGLDVDPEPLSAEIGPPEIRRVGYLAVSEPSARAFDERAVRADPLMAFEPLFIERDTTAALWVTYYVPPECPAGVYEGRIGIRLGGRAKRYVNVALEVFDFEIPATPNVTVAMQLEPETIRTFFGLSGDTLEEWRPFYDALAPLRIAYNAAPRFPDTPGGMDPYLENILYSAASARMSAIRLGMGETLANRLTNTSSSAVSLQTAAAALANQGWGRRGYAEPLPPLPRSHWPETKLSYNRFRDAVPSVKRLLRGAPHPELEALAEIWVLPLQFFDPIAIQRLRMGMAMSAEPAHPLEAARASSSARIPTPDMPYAAAPSDAYDGSLYTAWVSEVPPARESPQWLELRLQEPVSTKTIRVGWRIGQEAADPRVRLATDERQWNIAQIRWTHYLSDTPYDPSWSEGVFDRVKTFRGIRFEFTSTLTGAPVSVTGVELGRPPDPASIAYLSGGARVWLEQGTMSFPSFHADAHPVEARLGPWMCWGHELDGLFGQPLNRWPEAWKQLDTPTPETWPAAGSGEQFLVYPAAGTLAPSTRLYRLRDGLEDFEYIQAAREAGLYDRLFAPNTMHVCRWEHYDSDVDRVKLDAMTTELQQLRIAIGRALTRAAREN